MVNRISLRDIAKELGVHVSTVSLALRNHRKISAATRERVKEAAERLGYHPDPMMGALCAYRQSRQTGYRETIAWIDSYPTTGPYWYEGYFTGATARASGLGYAIERFWLHEKGMTVARLNSVLRSRGTHGVMVAPQPISHAHMRLEWGNFAAVRFGYSLHWPQLHLVTSHQFLNILNCVRHTAKLGFKRIGLAISKYEDERVGRNFSGGYAAAQATIPEANRMPPCIHTTGYRQRVNATLSKSGAMSREILPWVEKYRPDAIIALSGELMGLLEGQGLDIQVVQLALADATAEPTQPGIDERREEIGRAAVEYVADMIRRGERGIPLLPRMLMVPGIWRNQIATKGPIASANQKVGQTFV